MTHAHTTPHIDAPYHTLDDVWLASYASGGLSNAQRFVLRCQAAIQPVLRAHLNTLDTVGGTLLETAKGEALSDAFMAQVFTQIKPEPLAKKIQTAQDEQRSHNFETIANSWLPKPLLDFFTQTNKPLQWKSIGMGVARLPLLQEGREKLYLLKSKPGQKIPSHSHYGEEWTLILHGGYHVGDVGYVRGDLHREDETNTHRPIIDDDGEACITLVASVGGVKFTNPVFRLLKPFLGI